jgi:hypothetical protein
MSAYEFASEALPELLPEFGAAHEYQSEADAEAEAVAPAAAMSAARAALAAVAGGADGEAESELNPVRRWYPDAMFEHLAHRATEAETEDEAAEAFLPLIPLVAAKLLPLAAKAAPLIAKAMPKVMSAVSRVTPQLTRGVANVARTLHRTPATRRLLQTVPTIAQRAVGQIARQVAAGRPVTAQTAVRALAQQTARVLRQPTRVRRVMTRSRLLDRQLHRAISTGMASGQAGSGGYSVAGVAAVPRTTARGCRCGGCVCR